MPGRFFVSACAIGCLAWAAGVARPGLHNRYPAGIVVLEEPRQSAPSRTDHWTRDQFLFTSLADYHITARVMSATHYWFGVESNVSPLDLSVVWGPLSDQSVLDRLTFTNGHRHFSWRSNGELPLPQDVINSHAANMHLIPANDAIERKLKSFTQGDTIELSGSLVQVETAAGWRWVSSLSRQDTGDGACELMWVDEAKLVRHAPG